MTNPSRGTIAGRTYRDLQNQARRDRRPFDELLTLYTLEGFLDRLAGSPHANNLVLKGGLLLAAYHARRPTKDADFAARLLANQVPVITGVVKDPARITIDDGLRFDAHSARGETTREDDLYSGVRVHLDCHLATAHTRLKVDVSVGDPISPAPQQVNVPRLLHPADTIDLLGYPLHMGHAEKIVTAIQRGTVNTRWRDFADIYLLCRSQPVDARLLHDALAMAVGHRRAVLAPLAHVLTGFADVLVQVFAFPDPAVTGAASDAGWRTQDLAWMAQ